MTKMAAMHVYGKDLKNVFFGTKRATTLNFGMHNWVLKYDQVCLNDDPGLTLTYLRQGQIWFLMLLYGEKGKTMDFSATIVVWFKTSNKWPKWQEVSVDIKPLSPGGCMSPCHEAIYMY